MKGCCFRRHKADSVTNCMSTRRIGRRDSQESTRAVPAQWQDVQVRADTYRRRSIDAFFLHLVSIPLCPLYCTLLQLDTQFPWFLPNSNSISLSPLLLEGGRHPGGAQQRADSRRPDHPGQRAASELGLHRDGQHRRRIQPQVEGRGGRGRPVSLRTQLQLQLRLHWQRRLPAQGPALQEVRVLRR